MIGEEKGEMVSRFQQSSTIGELQNEIKYKNLFTYKNIAKRFLKQQVFLIRISTISMYAIQFHASV